MMRSTGAQAAVFDRLAWETHTCRRFLRGSSGTGRPHAHSEILTTAVFAPHALVVGHSFSSELLAREVIAGIFVETRQQKTSWLSFLSLSGVSHSGLLPVKDETVENHSRTCHLFRS